MTRRCGDCSRGRSNCASPHSHEWISLIRTELGKNLVQHFAFDIRQPEITTVEAIG
jgi:hypothetical protein